MNKVQSTNLKPEQQKIVNDIVSKLDQITSAREEWQTSFDRSNESLYQLLAACLEIYHQIKGKSVEAAVIGSMKSALESRGLPVTARTKILTLIVRYVFSTRYKRAFTYSRALRIAVKAGITSETFAQWVLNSGGIEDVAANGATPKTLAKNALLTSKKVEVHQYLANFQPTPFGIVQPDAFIQDAGERDYTLMLAKTDATGQSKVLCSVPNTSEAMIEACITKVAEAMIKNGINVNSQTTSAVNQGTPQAINTGFQFVQLPDVLLDNQQILSPS